MPETFAPQKKVNRGILLPFFTKTTPLLFLSLGLFFGGVALLALRIPFWGLFLGLPAVQIGIIFLIFSFDEIAQNKVGIQSLQIIPCSVCKDPTLAHLWEMEKVCVECQKKLAKKLIKKKD